MAVQIGQALGHNIDDDDDDDNEDNNIEALASSMFGVTNATIALFRIDNFTIPFYKQQRSLQWDTIARRCLGRF